MQSSNGRTRTAVPAETAQRTYSGHRHIQPQNGIIQMAPHHASEGSWRMLQLLLILLLLLFLIANFTFAQPGGGATAFLQRPVGPEAIGMGNAYTSIAADPSAIYWNGAGLTQSNRYRTQFSYSILPLGQRHNLVALSAPLPGQFSIGGGWINYAVDGIEGRDENMVRTGEFGSSDNAFIIQVARQVVSTNRMRFSLSAGGKYLYSTIAGVTASGFGLEAGSLFQYDRLSVGIALSNIAGSIRWRIGENTTDRIPFTFRGGFSYEFPLGANRAAPSIRVALEGAKTETRNTILLSGVEARMDLGLPRSSIAFRAGYGDRLFSGGLSFGLGIDRSMQVEVQYAASEDFLTSGMLHHLGMMVSF